MLMKVADDFGMEPKKPTEWVQYCVSDTSKFDFPFPCLRKGKGFRNWKDFSISIVLNMPALATSFHDENGNIWDSSFYLNLILGQAIVLFQK
jgi:hypothetical protein